QPDVIMTTFGDMMRVPGGRGSFFDSKAAGADIRMVYSPLDSLKIAKQNPAKHVVFMAIGFETTAPSTAMTVLRAKADGLDNFSIFCNHVTIIPAIKAILDSPDLRLDGFLGPGHVSTVIGCRPYEFIAAVHRKPLVCAGFDPPDILQSVAMLLEQPQQVPCEGTVFQTACRPETPIGSCMVWCEGACAVDYSFVRLTREGVRVAITGGPRRSRGRPAGRGGRAGRRRCRGRGCRRARSGRSI